MTDWFEHWNAVPAALADDDVLRQVGKTVGGQPVPASVLEVIMSDVVPALQLNRADSLLDLCCGNGLITERCAALCHHTIGVDFSAPLIHTANQRRSRPNVAYVQADVRALPAGLGRYSKVLLYEGIQHLTAEDVDRVLEQLRESHAPGAPILFGSVPERDRIWNFYDTLERRAEYQLRAAEGTEAIGHWWTKAELSDVGRRWGYQVQILTQHPTLHTAHYRFDGLLTPESD
jgi:2-polyprenyl-3-methyl-5-hydroxy-6-metoxy-1,4-benzoquinol methylase